MPDDLSLRWQVESLIQSLELALGSTKVIERIHRSHSNDPIPELIRARESINQALRELQTLLNEIGE